MRQDPDVEPNQLLRCFATEAIPSLELRVTVVCVFSLLIVVCVAMCADGDGLDAHPDHARGRELHAASGFGRGSEQLVRAGEAAQRVAHHLALRRVVRLPLEPHHVGSRYVQLQQHPWPIGDHLQRAAAMLVGAVLAMAFTGSRDAGKSDHGAGRQQGLGRVSRNPHLNVPE